MGCKQCRNEQTTTESLIVVGESNTPTKFLAESLQRERDTEDYNKHCIRISCVNVGKLICDWGRISPIIRSCKISPTITPEPRIEEKKDEVCIIQESSRPTQEEPLIILKPQKHKKVSAAFGSDLLILESIYSIAEDYCILGVIGKGAYGEVKKVKHKKTGKLYAMKVIRKSLIEENSNILNEIEILKRLDHPNIVRLHEFAQDGKYYYLITEYCEGGGLFNYIIGMKNFSERQAARIIQQLLMAVAYCHSRNVVHRDLKPDNLVLETASIDSHIKVIDFGTSTIFKPMEILKDVKGTPHYIAPEVIHEEYTEKCDIWSCGVILYVLLSGNPPFVGETSEEILRKIERSVISFQGPEWKKVSKESVLFLKKLLNYRTDKRLSAEEALNDPWLKTWLDPKILKEDVLLDSLRRIQIFKTESNLQRAVLAYMAGHIVSKEEEKKTREVFLALDCNHDGQLTRDELLKGYMTMYNNDKKLAEKQVEQTMLRLDINKNNKVDYNEFLMANLRDADIVNEEKLLEVFRFFDADRNGQITIEEMSRVFAVSNSEKVIEEIIHEADLNMDGQISFHEFSSLMNKFVKISS